MKSKLFSALWMVSCAGLSSEERLRMALSDYHDAVRWGNLPAAQPFVEKGVYAAFLQKQRLARGDLDISDYEIEQVSISRERQPRQATVQVSWVWSRRSESIVRQTFSEQTWQQEGRDWILVSEKRTQGPPMGWLQ